MLRSKILSLSDVEIMQIARQLRSGYQLKRTLRYATMRDFAQHSESVGEHVFALLLLTEYFLPLEDPTGVLSYEKICRQILYHDFPEIKHGDVPYHLKTQALEDREREAAQEVFDSLPSKMAAIGYTCWAEYEARNTGEARFVYALDKIEPLFELMDSVNEKSMKRLTFTYTDHIVRKRKATDTFPVMRRFVEVVSNDMLARSVFWPES